MNERQKLYEFNKSLRLKYMPGEHWQRYYGCSHNRIEPTGIRRGGGISALRWIGRKLDDHLWEDIVERIGAQTLWLIFPGMEEWTLGHMTSHVTLYLNEDGEITDFYLCGCFS